MSRVNYTKDDFNYMANRRRVAFREIAERLGEKHPITKMMGSRAWGRSNFEQGVDGNLRTAIEEKAAFDGAFDVINTWARENDSAAQRIILAIYPSTYEKAP